MEISTILPVSWETCTQVKKQQLERCMEELIISVLKKEQGCLLLNCLFNLYTEHIMKNASLNELQAAIKIGGKNIKTSDMCMIPL